MLKREHESRRTEVRKDAFENIKHAKSSTQLFVNAYYSGPFQKKKSFLLTIFVQGCFNKRTMHALNIE